ncbi:ATP phosphoribosyltransferase regulatory subunit [Pollutimonas thiosulfatoxidans]|uniref:ATP phosphoribosyltransferase regulatory subunit n=1 Tax=Pollutimonas thiosulfatoxidans TaxID=2028345 RepID=A0A410GB94_9BURK|nr:ATP phosphoribosyltransferase regulatory subunit [Pollutimonas thiosulfatoxidans]MBF6617341.1 ATP phosphoribosyltransferase regulatory subunit [Candidimonas sp.]NYT46252.1 ATP phosphoribosyltransferase regulatory subunit [Alcaligenaceae bacterium]QAA93566.1 ATP phosphoribosyltransferase regulatory subunit [Pollutimonas thiosulfatoxidans]
MSKWLLPESLADILPAEARRIEELRRDLLDLYRTYGFELVAPPLVEYLDSLLSGSGADLNLRTCKLVDQLSGRTLGVRADMTPQVSRIDAHLLNREGVTRLCYCGSVLHARPTGLLSDRELLQIGAEIYGHAGFEADIEIIELALESVKRAGVREARLDLNHPAVLRAIVDADPALAVASDEIHRLLDTKDVPGLDALHGQLTGVRADSIESLRVLASLYGGTEVIAKARLSLPALPAIQAALNDLETLIRALPDYQFSVDLADMGSGYGYHTGVVFSIYAHGWHDALVRGGRYDGVGSAFGRSRPATGFSLDLRKLSSGLPPAARARAIRAPWGTDAALVNALRKLRLAGEIVVQMLPGQAQRMDEFSVDRELVLDDGTWKVRAISNPSAD